MQSKLPEFFAQGKARQSQPARGFGLIAFRQQNGLRKDFAFGFSEHVGMGVLELAFLRPLQKITGAGGKGIAGRGSFNIPGGHDLANGVGANGEPSGVEQ